MRKQEKFSSNLGFLLVAAGCAIGLGNVWRFPYITGQYGGAAFVLVYLLFLAILGLPIIIMELSVGRASGRSIAKSFEVLEPKGSKWHLFSWFGMAGNYLLMMFYTTIGGWILSYLLMMIKGDFVGKSSEQVSAVFVQLTGDPVALVVGMVIIVLIGFGVCSLGLQKGVEKITKFMMLALFGILIVLVVKAVTLDGAKEGLKFYMMPNLNAIREHGVGEMIFAAMGQAFFTLSIGIGSIAIFGSYIGKDRRLTGEAVKIAALDTFVAIMAGLIIFPACSAFNVDPQSGPGLVFQTLPNIFNSMSGGRIWGILFFVFMAFAALSTVIAVFENVISFANDLWGWSRKKAILINLVAIIVLSLPATLGFNLLDFIKPFGEGSTILDLEDFIISNNLLPLGSLVYLTFCVTRYGWGWDNFIAEANEGVGMKFPKAMRLYLKYLLPLLIIYIFVYGYIDKFF
ncbi:MAG: sodium-dependent transporter [Oscillospiraceae bacterium]